MRASQPARCPMGSKSNIALKARNKAAADFATWLMMAKLGGFDDLPANAQSFLVAYRARLETMSEAESTDLAIREVYTAYYSEMGGEGPAPQPQVRKPVADGNVVQLQRRAKSQPTPAVARQPFGPRPRKPLPVVLIFAGMVVLIVLYRFLAP